MSLDGDWLATVECHAKCLQVKNYLQSVGECSVVLLGNSVMWDVLDILCTKLSLRLWLPLFKFYVNVKYHQISFMLSLLSLYLMKRTTKVTKICLFLT